MCQTTNLLTFTSVDRNITSVATDPNVNETIGAEIKRVRDSLGMTLEQFGERTGIPWQTIAGYESGRAMPPADRLLRILHTTRKAEKPFRADLIANRVVRAAA